MNAPGGRLLITGGAGFIGSQFVRRWLRDGRGPVWNLDKLTYAGRLDSLCEARSDPQHHFVQGDVADPSTVGRLLENARPDVVVHMAAESHVDRSIESPSPFVTTNVVGAHTLLDAALLYWQTLDADRQPRFRLLNVSTDEAYGSAEPGKSFLETDRYAPNSPYAATKAAAAHLTRAYHRTYGLPTVTSLGSNTYGPFQHPEKLIPTAILAALRNRPIPVYGDGLQQRDWIHVDDHCDALLKLLTDGEVGETYNVAGSGPIANRDLLGLLLDRIDARLGRDAGASRRLLRASPDRPGHDRRYALDATRLASLGWRPETPLDDGLESTVAWYMENAAWLAEYDEADYQKRRGLERERRDDDSLG